MIRSGSATIFDYLEVDAQITGRHARQWELVLEYTGSGKGGVVLRNSEAEGVLRFCRVRSFNGHNSHPRRLLFLLKRIVSASTPDSAPINCHMSTHANDNHKG